MKTQNEEDALHLPQDYWARLALRLLESLDDEFAADADKLWADEANRRAQEIDERNSTSLLKSRSGLSLTPVWKDSRRNVIRHVRLSRHLSAGRKDRNDRLVLLQSVNEFRTASQSMA